MDHWAKSSALLLFIFLWFAAANSNEPEGENNRRIIGGYRTTREFPWMVYVGPIGGKNRRCAGVLIGSQYVLTAAHCALTEDKEGFLSATPVGSTRVVVGCEDLQSVTCRAISVKRIIIHPCYVPGSTHDHDDLAILHLSETVMDIPTASVNGLEEEIHVEQGSNVSLTGWGKTSNDDTMGSFDLLRVDVEVASRDKCEAANPEAVLNGFLDFEKTICTGGVEGKDSCGGDSGGPAISTENGQIMVVGVLSKGSEFPSGGDCAVEGRFGVYIATKHYTDFMQTTLSGGNYECMSCPCEDSIATGNVIKAIAEVQTSAQSVDSWSNIQTTPTLASELIDEQMLTTSLAAGIVMGAGGMFLVFSCLGFAYVCYWRYKIRKNAEEEDWRVHATAGLVHSPLGNEQERGFVYRPTSAEQQALAAYHDEFTRRSSSNSSVAKGRRAKRPESAVSSNSVNLSVVSEAPTTIGFVRRNAVTHRRHSIEVESPKHRKPSLAERRANGNSRRPSSAEDEHTLPRRHSSEVMMATEADVTQKQSRDGFSHEDTLKLDTIDEPFSPIFNATSNERGKPIQYSLKPKPRHKEGKVFRASNMLLRAAIENSHRDQGLDINHISLPGARMTPSARDDFTRGTSNPEPRIVPRARRDVSPRLSFQDPFSRAQSNPEPSLSTARVPSDPGDRFKRSLSSVRRSPELAWNQ